MSETILEKKNNILYFASITISLYSLFFYTGFIENYLIFIFLFFFLKVKNMFINKEFKGPLNLLASDIILSFIILTINDNSISNGIISIRGRLHAISPILLPLAVFIYFEYYSFYLKCGRNFERFASNQSNWPLIAILIAFFNSFSFNFKINSFFLGFIVPDILSIIHIGIISTLIIYTIAILVDISNSRTKNIIKQIPILLLFLFIMLCKSKATILCFVLSLILIFKKDIIEYLYKQKNIPEKIVNSFISIYIVAIILIFFTITIYSFNPFLFGKSNQYLSKIFGYRQITNNSYIKACSFDDLNKSFPALTYNSELYARDIRSSQLFGEKILNIRKSLMNKYLEQGLIYFGDEKYILNYSPHYSFINYYCYHGKFYSFLFLSMLITSTFIIIRYSGLNISLIFLITNGSMLFEYAYFIPSFFLSIFLTIYLLKKGFYLNNLY